MMGLPGKKVLQMKKVPFPQMTMGAFSEKKIDLARFGQLWPKTEP